MDAFPLRTDRFLLSRTVLSVLLFLFFLFASGELLYVQIGIFKPKIGHLLAVFLFGWLILQKRKWTFPNGLMKAFLWILGAATLSTIFSAAPLRSIGYLFVYLFNCLFYFFLPFQLLQTIDLAHFFKLYWSSFVVVGLYAIAQVVISCFGAHTPFALQSVGFFDRGQAWTYEPSYYALYMVPYVMFYNGMGLLRESSTGALYRRFKLFGQNLFLIVSTSTGLLVTYPAFFGIFFIAAFFKKFEVFRSLIFKKVRKGLLIFLISLGGVTVVFYETALHTLFKFFYFGFQNHSSFITRWQGIVASFEIFLKNPLVGVGFGGIGPYLFQEKSAYDFKMVTLDEFEAYDPTNSFTEILASLGLVGLMGFVYLGYLFYQAYREVMEKEEVDSVSKKMATALFFSLILMVIALQMNQGLFRPYVWMHAAVVYGYLYRLSPTKEAISS